MSPGSVDDQVAFLALFDRTFEYAELARRRATARIAMAIQRPAGIARAVRRLRKELDTSLRIDFFPNDALTAAESFRADFDKTVRCDLTKLAALVHAPDVGCRADMAASGFEPILYVERLRLADDDALLAAFYNVQNSLHAHYRQMELQ